MFLLAIWDEVFTGDQCNISRLPGSLNIIRIFEILHFHLDKGKESLVQTKITVLDFTFLWRWLEKKIRFENKHNCCIAVIYLKDFYLRTSIFSQGETWFVLWIMHSGFGSSLLGLSWFRKVMHRRRKSYLHNMFHWYQYIVETWCLQASLLSCEKKDGSSGLTVNFSVREKN